MKTNQNTFSAIIAVLAVIFTLAAFTACPQPAEDPKKTPEPWEWEAIAAKSTIPAGWEEAMEEAWLELFKTPEFASAVKTFASIKIVQTSSTNMSDNFLKEDNHLIIQFNPAWYGNIIEKNDARFSLGSAVSAAMVASLNKSAVRMASSKAFAKKIAA